MAAIPNTIPLGGTIAPTDTTDVYATHMANYGMGGIHHVTTLTERDAITDQRRVEGMLCSVAQDGKIYQLIGGITNDDWTEFKAGASLGGMNSSGIDWSDGTLVDLTDSSTNVNPSDSTYVKYRIQTTAPIDGAVKVTIDLPSALTTSNITQGMFLYMSVEGTGVVFCPLKVEQNEYTIVGIKKDDIVFVDVQYPKSITTAKPVSSTFTFYPYAEEQSAKIFGSNVIVKNGAEAPYPHYEVVTVGYNKEDGIPASTKYYQMLSLNDERYLTEGSTLDNTIARLYGGVAAEGVNDLLIEVLPQTTVTNATTQRAGIVIRSAYGTIGKALYPQPDNQLQLGVSSSRWKQVFAATATISTSDERLKDEITDFPDELLDAWGDIRLCLFKFKDAEDEKGPDKARLHAGGIAQRIDQVFKSHGLDAPKYGFFCYDEWPEINVDITIVDKEAVIEKQYVIDEPAVFDESGNEIKPEEGHIEEIEIEPSVTHVEHYHEDAGNRFSLRYEEFLCIEAAYQRRRADRLEERLADLERRLDKLEG